MRRILSVLIFLITLSTYGQKEANYWYFGQKAGLDFSSGSPVVLNDGQLETLEGCSTISDESYFFILMELLSTTVHIK